MKKGDYKIDDINLLIVSYLTRSISEEDLVQLKEWINLSEENRNHFNDFKNAWILSGSKNSSSITDTEESWRIFKNSLTPYKTRLVLRFMSQGKTTLIKYLKMAASWLLIFSLGSAITWWITRKPVEVKAISENRTIEISTPLGARSLIKMSDSTQIWLNAGTTITYGQDYGQVTRTLYLKGEAYFKVSKDSLHPFIVNTQGISVRALGTQFNVKAYPEEKTISATLEEGKINISILNRGDKNETVLLIPKEKLIFYKKTEETEKYTESSEANIKPQNNGPIKIKDINILSDVRTELYTSWKDPRWIIDREPLSSLAPMLERRFNMLILFTEEQIKQYKFTGTIENETVDQILSALTMTAPLDYQINRDTIRLSLNLKDKEAFKRILTTKE
jgi:transmembrane sensor